MSSVCRLCLNTESKSYQDIETVERQQFDIVLPEMNLNITSSTRICTNCVEMLQRAYTFKIKCLETEKILRSYEQFVRNENVKDLGDVINYQCINIKQEDVKIEADDNDVVSTAAVNNEDHINYECPNEEGPVCLISYKNTDLTRHIEDEMKNCVKQHLDLYSTENRTELLCLVCRKKFVNIEQLIEHVKLHFAMEERETIKVEPTAVNTNITKQNKKPYKRKNPYKCHLCPRSYQKQHNLTTHLNNHINGSHCKICNQTFLYKGHYIRHIGIMHKLQTNLKDSDLLYSPCNVNSLIEKMGQREDRNEHRINAATEHCSLKHKVVRLHPCNICNRMFKEDALKRHIELIHKKNTFYTYELSALSVTIK